MMTTVIDTKGKLTSELSTKIILAIQIVDEYVKECELPFTRQSWVHAGYVVQSIDWFESFDVQQDCAGVLELTPELNNVIKGYQLVYMALVWSVTSLEADVFEDVCPGIFRTHQHLKVKHLDYIKVTQNGEDEIGAVLLVKQFLQAGFGEDCAIDSSFMDDDLFAATLLAVLWCTEPHTLRNKLWDLVNLLWTYKVAHRLGIQPDVGP